MRRVREWFWKQAYFGLAYGWRERPFLGLGAHRFADDLSRLLAVAEAAEVCASAPTQENVAKLRIALDELNREEDS